MLNRKLRGILLVICVLLIFTILSSAQDVQFKVKLNLFERLVALSFYQQAEGSFATLKIVKELQMELAPTEEEYKLAGLKDLPNGGVNADNWFAVPEKEIIFGDKAKEIIVNALKKLNDSEKLKQEQFSLYEKFILSNQGGN
jgi:hypothetical protein